MFKYLIGTHELGYLISLHLDIEYLIKSAIRVNSGMEAIQIFTVRQLQAYNKKHGYKKIWQKCTMEYFLNVIVGNLFSSSKKFLHAVEKTCSNYIGKTYIFVFTIFPTYR